jgi:hypothetical protein
VLILFPISIGSDLVGIAALLLNRWLKLAPSLLLVFTLSLSAVFLTFWAMESGGSALALMHGVQTNFLKK